MSAANQGFGIDCYSGGSFGLANKLVLYPKNDGVSQKFKFVNDGGNIYSLFCQKNSGTVEIPVGSFAKGVHIEVGQQNGAVNAKWEVTPVTQGVYANKGGFYIKGCKGLVLDIFEGNIQAETKIIQWDVNGGNNQVWIIVPA